MSMIDRYKKHGGFVQLLQLIETTEHAKSEKFLKMIAEENPVWEAEIRKKVLSIDRLLGWNQTYLMEFLPRLSAKAVQKVIRKKGWGVPDKSWLPGVEHLEG